MAFTNCEKKCLKDLLKKSLVPLPCQECQLSSTGRVNSESIEWLLDLNDIPVWSRLNDINTSGFKRNLPMSMTKHYDIEIKGRLWSLWGHTRRHRKPKCDFKCSHKSYMATTVLALCAARVIRLNVWNSMLMDCIVKNGRMFYAKSLNNFNRCNNNFQLENLDASCCLEGISFEIHIKTVQKGCLYSVPLKCQPNLSYALIKFFAHYQFGLVECNQRILGFGFIDGPSGGYFMYDAQSIGFPIFEEQDSAPYLLRTNHLQVLLYCLIVSLDVTNLQVAFCLHRIKIKVAEPVLPKVTVEPSENTLMKCKRILPKEYWNTPSIMSLKTNPSARNSCKNFSICKSFANMNQPTNDQKSKPKYLRKFHNITKEEEQNSVIKPLVDADRKSDENQKINKDFVRMICSDTMVALTPAEETKRMEKDFVHNLLDVLVMGPTACVNFNKV